MCVVSRLCLEVLLPAGHGWITAGDPCYSRLIPMLGRILLVALLRVLAVALLGIALLRIALRREAHVVRFELRLAHLMYNL